jgi:hypothetical protein
LSFNKAKLTIVKGKDNKNFPPIANKIAKITNPTNKKNLKLWDIFFEAILAKNLSKRYKLIKNNTV